jgi:hypothetical protein
MTPVVVREIAFDALIDEIFTVCGRDAGRMIEVLARGSLVSGATRYRWASIRVEAADIEPALARLPVAEPERRFDPQRCTHIIFGGLMPEPALERGVAAANGLLHRQNFWDELLRIAPSPVYVTYDHRRRADIYSAPLDIAQRAQLQAALALLRQPALAHRLSGQVVRSIDYVVPR